MVVFHSLVVREDQFDCLFDEEEADIGDQGDAKDLGSHILGDLATIVDLY